MPEFKQMVDAVTTEFNRLRDELERLALSNAALRAEASRRCGCEFEPGRVLKDHEANPGPTTTCGYHVFGSSKEVQKLRAEKNALIERVNALVEERAGLNRVIARKEEELEQEKFRAEAWVAFVKDARKALGAAGQNDIMKSVAWCIERLAERQRQAERERDGAKSAQLVAEANRLGAKSALRVMTELVREGERAKFRLMLAPLFMASGKFEGTLEGAVGLVEERIKYLQAVIKRAEEERDSAQAAAREGRSDAEAWAKYGREARQALEDAGYNDALRPIADGVRRLGEERVRLAAECARLKSEIPTLLVDTARSAARSMGFELHPDQDVRRILSELVQGFDSWRNIARYLDKRGFEQDDKIKALEATLEAKVRNHAERLKRLEKLDTAPYRAEVLYYPTADDVLGEQVEIRGPSVQVFQYGPDATRAGRVLAEDLNTAYAAGLRKGAEA